jgi:hypothetical protein
MKTWEYFVVQIDANIPAIQAYFSQLGTQGWELVSVYTTQIYFSGKGFGSPGVGRPELGSGSATPNVIAVFKRPNLQP